LVGGRRIFIYFIRKNWGEASPLKTKFDTADTGK
jgi:hypothetical protein